jgi:hypothetical protein
VNSLRLDEPADAGDFYIENATAAEIERVAGVVERANALVEASDVSAWLKVSPPEGTP